MSIDLSQSPNNNMRDGANRPIIEIEEEETVSPASNKNLISTNSSSKRKKIGKAICCCFTSKPKVELAGSGFQESAAHGDNISRDFTEVEPKGQNAQLVDLIIHAEGDSEAVGDGTKDLQVGFRPCISIVDQEKDRSEDIKSSSVSIEKQFAAQSIGQAKNASFNDVGFASVDQLQIN